MSLDIKPKPARQAQGRPSLEAVIVCVDYSDFLEVTLPLNQPYFDHIVVVTTHEDKETQRVCRKHGIDPVLTQSFYEYGDSFAKARGINLGLSHCRYNDWIIHLDADILLPRNFRNQLFIYPLQEDSIYGADRQNIVGREAFQNLLLSDHYQLQHGYQFLLKRGNYDNGSRLINHDTGYAPIGFFQLFNASYLHEHGLKYPQYQTGADRTDVLFSLQWPMVKRILLPTVSVFHLESQRLNQGVNWHGRKSPPF